MKNKNQLGCMTWPAIIATAITFFVITGTVFAQGHGLFSPGDLNAKAGSLLGNISSHAQISSTCDQCHTAPWDGDFMQDRCMRCHTDIKLELADPHKLHGILLNKQAVLECRKCHPEHRGASASLTDVTLNEFPHELLGFATTSHKKIPDGSAFICQTCHVSGYKAFKTSDCADCHAKLDKTFMAAHTQEYAADCRACHDGKESINKKFDHTKAAFNPLGAHLELTCAKCHTGAQLVADFKGLPAKCVDCHLKDDHHGEKFGTTCDACHTQKNWKDAHFDHAVTGFVLAGKHEKVECIKCHTTPDEYKNAPQTCVGCHLKDDKHAGSEGTACENCHTNEGWKPSSFNHESVFKLDGKHSTVECQSCHTTPFQFKNAPQNCVGCHQKDDKHAGTEGSACETCHVTSGWKPSTFKHDSVLKLVGAHVNLPCANCHTTPFQFKNTPQSCFACHQGDDKHAGSEGAACDKCHTPDSWKPSTFKHDSVFKLVGAHADAACAQCHKTPLQFHDAPTTCIGCHQKDDKHAGTEGTACEKCHTTTSWKPATFNHDGVFKLVGAHTSATCIQCHTTPFQFKNAPTTCFGCHQKDDKHSGTEGTACEKCHTLSSWKPSTFNHDSAIFKLTGAHVSAVCAKCHAVPGMFKGAPSDCVSCHLTNDAHKGDLGTACGSCHTTTAWKPSTFNHNTTAFKLTGLHTTTQCIQCHIKGKFKGTPTTCIGCHQSDDKHAGSEGSACENCHSTSGWKPSTFNHSSAFKLVGAHTSLACAKCHTVPFQFKNAPTTCFGCHQSKDVHAGTEGTACESCHTPTSWKPSTFNHNNAAFILTGAHVNAVCAKCHTTVGMFKGTPSNCVSCHLSKDAHAGAYGTSCGTCHSTTAWKPATFDHNLSVFKLTGAHVSTSCAKCHINGKFKGTPQDCYSCHASDDNHGGAYGKLCNSCHTTTAWKPATFDHNLSSFPLTGAHKNQACSACHANGVFKGTPSACASCHGEPAYHAGMFGTDCASCHSTTNWNATYNGPHTFPMKHGKGNGTCATCHPSTLGQWTCYNCHKQSEIASKHKNISDFSNCIQCHPTGKGD